MRTESAVEFRGKSRIHVAIEVADLTKSLEFYRILFGTEPTKQRPGYVKFEPDDPSVNFTLNERPGERPRQSQEPGAAVTHYGIQVKSVEHVKSMDERFRRAGYAPRIEERTECCYAVQDKVWAKDPDGNSWEVFVVLEADAPGRGASESPCCAEAEHADSGGASRTQCC